MTCREKLQQEHPELVDDKWIGGCDGCPDEYGYLEVPDFCGGHERACTRCWDREIESEEKKMTVEELVKVLDKNSRFVIRACHTDKTIFHPVKDKEKWEEFRKKDIVQFTPIEDGIIIYVAPPTEK